MTYIFNNNIKFNNNYYKTNKSNNYYYYKTNKSNKNYYFKTNKSLLSMYLLITYRGYLYLEKWVGGNLPFLPCNYIYVNIHTYTVVVSGSYSLVV